MGPVVVLLEPLPDEVPENVRVKRALKYLLRSCRLRCTQLQSWPVTRQEEGITPPATVADCAAPDAADAAAQTCGG
jgi:hypothetical protein